MGGLSRAPSSNLVSREADRALIPSVRPMKRERKTALPPPGQAARESNKMPCRAGRAIQTSLAPLSLSFGLTIRMPTPARRAPRPGPIRDFRPVVRHILAGGVHRARERTAFDRRPVAGPAEAA